MHPLSWRRLAVGALLSGLAGTAAAHEIWFAQRAGRLALVYGAGAEDLDTVKRLPLVTAVRGFGAAGQGVPAALKATDSLVLVEAGPELATLTAHMDNGLWTKNRAGQWLRKGRHEVPDAVVSGRYHKYATHLRQLPVGPLSPLPGLRFQVVPVGAAFPQKMGESLTVQVLLDGKPVPGAKVYRDAVTDPGGEQVLTDRDGKATLRVRNAGLNVVLAEHQTAADDPATSLMTEHVATLSFLYPPPPE